MIAYGSSPHLPDFEINASYLHNSCGAITHTGRHENGVLVYLMFKASDGTWRDIGHVWPAKNNETHHTGYARPWGERIALDYDLRPIQWIAAA